MDRVTSPIQAFAIPFGGVENGLKILDALGRAAEPKNALNVRCCDCMLALETGVGRSRVPFSFRKTPHFATTIGT